MAIDNWQLTIDNDLKSSPLIFIFYIYIKGGGVVKVGVWGRCPQVSPLGGRKGGSRFRFSELYHQLTGLNKKVKDLLAQCDD